MGELTVIVCSIASVVLVMAVLATAIVSTLERRDSSEVARLAVRFGDAPGHAAWRALLAGQAQELGDPADEGIAGIARSGVEGR